MLTIKFVRKFMRVRTYISVIFIYTDKIKKEMSKVMIQNESINQNNKLNIYTLFKTYKITKATRRLLDFEEARNPLDRQRQ